MLNRNGTYRCSDQFSRKREIWFLNCGGNGTIKSRPTEKENKENNNDGTSSLERITGKKRC
jgi:hypothetical protein